MTIDEIKEWRKRGNIISKATLQIIDTLLQEVERLKSQPTGYYDNTKDVEQARQGAPRDGTLEERATR